MYKEIDNDRKPAILKESFPGPCTTARLEVKNGPKLTLAFRGPFPSKSLQSFKSCLRRKHFAKMCSKTEASRAVLSI